MQQTPQKDFVQLSGDWVLSNDEESNSVLDVAGLIFTDELKQRFESARLLRLSDVSFDVTVHGHGAKTDSGKGVRDVPGLRGAIG